MLIWPEVKIKTKKKKKSTAYFSLLKICIAIDIAPINTSMNAITQKIMLIQLTAVAIADICPATGSSTDARIKNTAPAAMYPSSFFNASTYPLYFNRASPNRTPTPIPNVPSKKAIFVMSSVFWTDNDFYGA